MRCAWTLGYSIVLSFLASTAWETSLAFSQVLSPGPLAKDHAKIDGALDCNKCHASGRKISTQACLQCHQTLGLRVQNHKGLHGVTYAGKECGGCHVDHLGRNAQLIKWPKGNRDAFNHDEAQWHLSGAHSKTACVACHKNKNSTGKISYIGQSPTCTSCHKDIHQGRLGQKCLGCHNESSWKDVKVEQFNHDLARYPLLGAHKTVKCEQCHKGNPPKYAPLNFQQCTDCHKDPHKGKFSLSCTSCHSEKNWKDLPLGFAKNHPGVSLAAGHADVKCVRCHDRGVERPPSKGSTCVSCHKPVHEAKFGTNCITCHASIQWMRLPPEIGLRNHKLTAFPLKGAHEKVKCAACHKPNLPEAQRYRGLEFGECKACHSDVHKGEFAKQKGGECAPCHNESAFRPSMFTVAMHNKTSFSIGGKHSATPCGSCHTSEPPRYNLHLNKKLCAQCHENPHGNQFAKEMLKGGCAHCHNAVSWQNVNIDHSFWPLTGVHATTLCSRCHNPTEADRKVGRGPSYKNVPKTCEGCHQDIHAGQFQKKGRTRTCDDCHNTDEFKIPNFDHSATAGYVLSGGHAKLECNACHKVMPLKNGQETVHYRLGYRECRDCHANPHVQRATAVPAAAKGGAP